MSDQKHSTRVSNAPDWMISGLVKAGAFAEQEPDQPMFNTGVTLSQLKEQVKSMLLRSGVNLTPKEISSGTYWLTQRIANQISEKDTKQTLIDKLNQYASQYIVDKSVQRETGVSQRSPIYDDQWYKENFTPPTDHNASVQRLAGLNENLAKLPAKCFAELPSNGELILIVRGEPGYTVISVHGQTDAKCGAQSLNEELGVTPEQAEAMMVGSMFGWHIPGADPDIYKGKKVGPYKTKAPSRSPVSVAPEGTKPPTEMNPRMNSIFASDEEVAAPEEQIEMVYVGLDGDDMGHMVEDSLLSDDPEIAAKISNSIHDAHRAIRRIVTGIGGRLIFDGGDNMLFYMPNDPEALESIRDTHKRIAKHTVTIGVGHRPIEAHYALVVGKNTGKDKTVIYNEKVKAQHETIHREQEQMADTERKLKYRASAEELNVADRLRQVLSASGEDASDVAVKELFWRLIQNFALDDMNAIESFFSVVDDAALAKAAKQVYAKRMDWNLRCSEARELSQTEGQAIFHNLIRAVESVEGLGPKFKALMDAVDSQDLRDLDEGMEHAWKHAEKVIAEFAEIVHEGGTLRYSHFANEVPGIAAEVMSMSIPVDNEIMTAMKAVGNAEDADNPAITLTPLIKIVGRWIERVNAMAMTLDMVCVVSGARPMESVAAAMPSAPVHFPGQSVTPDGIGQKSPHKICDWMSIEDYNRDKVDWRKTDDQAGIALPKDSEIMVGGDAGGSPIYVP